MRFRSESSDLYLALVADLSRTTVPTSVMGFYLVLVDWVAWSATGSSIYIYAGIAGGISSFIKVLLMRSQTRNLVSGDSTLQYAVRCESAHAILVVLVSGSVGISAAESFFQNNHDFQILTTSLLFGYCAGVAARLAVRPRIACLAIVIATCPAIFAASQSSDYSHRVLAGMLAVFLLGGFDTIRHLYGTNVRNITGRLEMATLARNDPLTGLANRLGLREAFRIAAKLPGKVAVHCLDLDGFKLVNDRLGHAGGDGVLVGVAQRLLSIAPTNTTVARVGGDEFVVLQAGILELDGAEALAREIVDVLSEPFFLDNHVIEMGASLGLCVSNENCSLDDLLCRADTASYVTKRQRATVPTFNNRF